MMHQGLHPVQVKLQKEKQSVHKDEKTEGKWFKTGAWGGHLLSNYYVLGTILVLLVKGIRSLKISKVVQYSGTSVLRI